MSRGRASQRREWWCVAPWYCATSPSCRTITAGNTSTPASACGLYETGVLPPHLRLTDRTFENLWEMHPAEYDRLRFMGRDIPTPRWQQAYGVDYVFSPGQWIGRTSIVPPLRPVSCGQTNPRHAHATHAMGRHAGTGPTLPIARHGTRVAWARSTSCL